jgi:aspartyl-tRNA synthetase
MADTASSSAHQWKRTIYCGLVRPEHAGREVTLLGWVQRQRDMGSLLFIDLRDREGLVQVVVPPDRPALLEAAKKLRPEFVVGVRGIVRKREGKAVNREMATGEVEVEAAEIKLFNPAKVPPFQVADPVQAAEDLRMKYRYIDLRRPSMQRTLRLRHEAAQRTRAFLSGQGFLEVETPFLGKSTPEGARDYLVPSRIYKGRFYALPQSPQLFKQTLMISGVDRYFQIARCFRDEDLRADRQPEFTQIDIEMSFADREDIYALVDGMMAAIFEVIGENVATPFPRLTYEESLERYGTDKPDLRIKAEIADLTAEGAGLSSEIIREALGTGGVLKGLKIDGGSGVSRSQLDKIGDRAKCLGARGIIWLKKQNEFKSSLRLGEAEARLLWDKMKAKEGDLVLLVADKASVALPVLGSLRVEQAPAAADTKWAFTWVTDFPLFEWSDEEKKIVAVHHPFTSPRDEDLPLLETEPLRARAKAYDIVLNGHEIGGGSIRMHDFELQRRIFKILGLSEKETEDKFGYFIEALGYGTPPHGGIAMGFDRIVMLLAGEECIREVIPFPKTTSSLCLLTGSPSEVSEKQLEELGLQLKK